MKLTTMFLSLTLLSGVVLSPAQPSGSHGAATQPPIEKQVPFRKVVNGRDNPSAISDTVAYDVFFRSLVFPAQESAEAESRLRALAGELEITAEEAYEIRAVAEEFTQNVAAFDESAAGVKEKHLPNLSSDDARELVGLQKRKEALITSTVASLPARLGRQLADTLRLHIGGYVKPRVRSLQPPAPEHQHDSAGNRPESVRFTKVGYGPAQNGGNFGMGGYGHLYLDGWKDATKVYGKGLVTEDYNTYGHTWSVNTRVYNPEGTRSQSQLVEWYRASTSSTTSLSILDDFGDFFIEVEIAERCPYIYGIIALGIFLLDPPETVPPLPLDVGFDKAFLQDSEDPKAPESFAAKKAPFIADVADFNIFTTTGPDACGGGTFVIQASFVPPPETSFCCAYRVSLSRDNKFDFATNPATGFRDGIFTDVGVRNPYVAVRLRRRKSSTGMFLGTSNSLIIRLSGTYKSGRSMLGHGFVRLICP